ncbi:MAG: hypothetical protein Tp167SUR398091_11 [Prokaryotic dsDNA virus sp.]|nr:MAG: hypothetical protein Tp167SUR398091_11 [Prokaryotic dsDNA virus sp.]|tara:strand:+ start:8746 stop:11910 length:3165 start_codon:yes stop_codon:yes gene_type:complete
MPIIREKRQVGSIGPVGVVRASGGSEEYNRLANATSNLTKLVVEEMGRRATLSGAEKAEDLAVEEITSINPITGKPEALDWINSNRFIGRAGAEAYERVVSDRFQLEIENQIKNKAKDVALTYEDTPYATKEYSNIMNTYIDSLAEGSKQNGKNTSYTNFIHSSGRKYIAATTLSMEKKQYEIQNAKILQAQGEKNFQESDLAYELGQQGSLKKFEQTLEANENRNQDTIDSGVQTNLQVKIASSSSMKSNYVSGFLERLYATGGPNGTILNANDRTLVKIAVGNKRIEALPKELKAQIKPLLKYIDGSNKRSIIAELVRFDGHYSVIESSNQRIANENLKHTYIKNSQYYESKADSKRGLYSDSFREAYSESGYVTTMISFNTDVQEQIDNIRKYTNREMHKSLEESARRSALLPIIAAVASEGNPSDVKTYLINQTSSVGDRLTVKQRQTIDYLYSNPSFYDPDLDRIFVNELLDGGEDKVKARLDAYEKNTALKNSNTDLIKKILDGEAGSKEIGKTFNEINKSTVLSDPEKNQEKSRILFNSAMALVNGLPETSSREINIFNEYISSNGNNNIGLSGDLLERAENILEATDETNREKITTKLTEKKTRLRGEELEAQRTLAEEAKIARNRIKAFSSSSTKNKDVREAMDGILKEHGFNSVFGRDTLGNQHFYTLLEKTIPQEFYEGGKSILQGQLPNENANIFMEHYNVLSNLDRGKRNALGSIFDKAEIAKLDRALVLKSFYGDDKSYSEIISEINFNETSSESKNKRQAILNVEGTQHTASSFLASFIEFDGKLVGNDPLVQTMYEGAVNMLASNGVFREDIKDQIEKSITQSFGKDEYVVDPNGLINGLSRDTIALTFPDKAEANEFVSRVNSQLPKGFSLGEPEDIVVSTTEVRRKGSRTGTQTLVKKEVVGKTRRVYLVPFHTEEDEVVYFSHILSRTKELIPLYMTSTGQVLEEDMDFIGAADVILPSFTTSETDEWSRQKRIEAQELFNTSVLKAQKNAEAMRNALSKRPNMVDGIAGIRETSFTRSLGALDTDKLIKYEGRK